MNTLLFIAPLPPPITGQAIASQNLLSDLKETHDVVCINFSKGNLKQGINSLNRIFDVIKIIKEVNKKSKDVNLIYLTISQSIPGVLKDLLLLFFSNNKPIILHLHGGGIGSVVFKKVKIFKWLYSKLLNKRKVSIIVLSDSLKRNFIDIVKYNKIEVIANSVENDLFLNKLKINEKYKTNDIRVLYLSNLMSGKGIIELFDAIDYINMKGTNIFIFELAGNIENKEIEKRLLELEGKWENVHYYGVVVGDKKRELLSKANIFILPTYYPYGEGQPISILEAYPSGCVVLTCYHGGIPDIFVDQENGYRLEKKSVDSIVEKLLYLEEKWKSDEIMKIAINNHKYAIEEFTEALNKQKFEKLIDSLLS